MDDKFFELLTKMYNELTGKMESMNNELTGKMDNMQAKIDNIEGDLNSLKNVVTRIEHNHGQKLDALFDGYKQINDRLDRIETEVSKHEEVILKRVR